MKKLITSLLFIVNMLSASAQTIDYSAGATYPLFFPNENTPWDASIDHRTAGPVLSVSLNDWRVKRKHSGLYFSIQQYGLKTQYSYEHNSSFDREWTNTKRTALHVIVQPLTLPLFKKAVTLKLGYGFNVLLAQKVEGEAHTFTAYPLSKMKDTTYALHGGQFENNALFSFGISPSISIRLFETGKINLHLKMAAFIGTQEIRLSASSYRPIRPIAELGMRFSLYSPQTIERLKKQVAERTDRKKVHRQKRQEQRRARIEGKPSILNKPLEFGGGANIYNFYLSDGFGSLGHSGYYPGWSFGVRIWDWQAPKKYPAISVNFQQTNFQFSSFWRVSGASNISSLDGRFQRNTLSLGLYPIKLLLDKKRIDIRLGLDINFLMHGKASGNYTVTDRVNRHDSVLFFNKDVLGINRKVSAGPIFTISGPIIRRANFCMKWRFTMACNIPNLAVKELSPTGFRQQAEMVYCRSLTFGKLKK